MAFCIRPIESHELDTWNAFVSESPSGTLFHTSFWKSIIEAAYSPASLAIVGCFEDLKLAGGCVFLDRTVLKHRTAVTPLLTPYSGFVLPNAGGEKLSDQVSRNSAILAALSKWLSSNFDYQSFTNAPALEDSRPLQAEGYTLAPRFTYHVNLRLPTDELWGRLDGSVRRQIRKAERQDFDVSDFIEPQEAYRLFAETFSRRGERCPVTPQLFNELLTNERLRDYRRVFCAHSGGQLVSFIVLLEYQGTFYYALASTVSDWLSSGISSYMVWEVIRMHACQEWHVLDFVGANIPSIARFKEGFNPKLVHCFQCEKFRTPYAKWGRNLVKLFRS